MKNVMNIFRELFQNVDIENQEIIDPLITEYNLRVRSLLVDMQTEYDFWLCCHDMEYNDVAVWTDLLQVSVIRSSTPLAPQVNQNAKIHKEGNSTETHSVQQMGSFLLGSNGTARNPETLDGKISIPCPQHQGLCTADKVYPVTTRWMHHVI